MTCPNRYAEAWQFASFLCVESLLSNQDNSGGAGNPFLTDTQADFQKAGIRPNVGMVLYNLTQGTNGQITVATGTTLTAPGTLWDDGDLYRVVALDVFQRSAIEQNLNVAATHITAALAASGACDCSRSPWATDFLALLNSIIAASFYSCTCGRPAVAAMSDDTRNAYREWAQAQIEALRDVRLEVCAGHTGSETPVTRWAEQGVSEFARAQIILNQMLKEL